MKKLEWLVLVACVIFTFVSNRAVEKKINKLIKMKDEQIEAQQKIIDQYWWLEYYNNVSEYKGEYEYYE